MPDRYYIEKYGETEGPGWWREWWVVRDRNSDPPGMVMDLVGGRLAAIRAQALRQMADEVRSDA